MNVNDMRQQLDRIAPLIEGLPAESCYLFDTTGPYVRLATRMDFNILVARAKDMHVLVNEYDNPSTDAHPDTKPFVTLSVFDLFAGSVLCVQAPYADACEACHGSGDYETASGHIRACKACDGRGWFK